MNSRQIRQSFILLLTAVIWGVAFVAQSVGMDYVGPFTFICVRSLIGGLVLLPCITLLDRLNGRQDGTASAGGRRSKEGNNGVDGKSMGDSRPNLNTTQEKSLHTACMKGKSKALSMKKDWTLSFR